jgi:hypothetical protein
VNRRNAVARLAAVVAGILGVTRVAEATPAHFTGNMLPHGEEYPAPWTRYRDVPGPSAMYTPTSYDREAGVWYDVGPNGHHLVSYRFRPKKTP